jgi:hypothetical protein
LPKPNFFIVGAPKCGTTAWTRYLSAHPGVFMATPKEPHYFNHDMPRYRWFFDRADYLALFDGAGEAKVVGEASVQYLYSTAAARAISEFQPGARILILLRDQEDFLPSYHSQLVFNGDENVMDFARAWRMSGVRDRSNVGPDCREIRLLDYKAVGRFSEQVERYLDCFPASQIRILHFDAWTRDPRNAYLEMLGFFGLEDDGRIDFPPINEAQSRRSNAIASFLRNPPSFLMRAVDAFRASTGMPKGLGARLARINRRAGYASSLSDTLRREIRAYYRLDNEKLRGL